MEYIYIYIYTHIQIYIHIYPSVERERERKMEGKGAAGMDSPSNQSSKQSGISLSKQGCALCGAKKAAGGAPSSNSLHSNCTRFTLYSNLCLAKGDRHTDGRTDGLSDQATRLLEFHMLYGTKNIS